MEIGPYVVLVVFALATPYMAYKRQWVLAGYFLVNAVAIVARFFGAGDLAGALTWLGFVLLAVGLYQLIKRLRVARSQG